MSSILSRIFKKKGIKGRKTLSWVQLAKKKLSQSRSRELENSLESCDAMSLLKRRAHRPVPKDDKESIKFFLKWCAEMGIEHHPHVSVELVCLQA